MHVVSRKAQTMTLPLQYLANQIRFCELALMFHQIRGFRYEQNIL